MIRFGSGEVEMLRIFSAPGYDSDSRELRWHKGESHWRKKTAKWEPGNGMAMHYNMVNRNPGERVTIRRATRSFISEGEVMEQQQQTTIEVIRK